MKQLNLTQVVSYVLKQNLDILSLKKKFLLLSWIGPDAKFEAFSAHREAFKPMPVPKRLNYKPKANIKTFDDNYLLSLEHNILKNKEKIRSVSLQSLHQDSPIEVVGEDEILYKADNYTNTFENTN